MKRENGERHSQGVRAMLMRRWDSMVVCIRAERGPMYTKRGSDLAALRFGESVMHGAGRQPQSVVDEVAEAVYLCGLADRVEVLQGRLRVDSPPGGDVAPGRLPAEPARCRGLTSYDVGATPRDRSLQKVSTSR